MYSNYWFSSTVHWLDDHPVITSWCIRSQPWNVLLVNTSRSGHDVALESVDQKHVAHIAAPSVTKCTQGCCPVYSSFLQPGKLVLKNFIISKCSCITSRKVSCLLKRSLPGQLGGMCASGEMLPSKSLEAQTSPPTLTSWFRGPCNGRRLNPKTKQKSSSVLVGAN